MIRTRVTNIIMAVGLVMIYFFIEGLSGDFIQVFQKIQREPSFIPADNYEAQELNTFGLSSESIPEDKLLQNPEQTDLVVKSDQSYSEVDSLAFHAPSQYQNPDIISASEDSISLSELPLRLVIPNLDLDAPVLPVTPQLVNIEGVNFQQWQSPDEYAVGWHEASARLGETGNTVLNGHHNVFGEVFRRLIELNETDLIFVYSEHHLFKYQITNKMIFPEKNESLDVRAKNAMWILPSQDERLTLITCWPYESNTHRLIIVARPLSVEELPDNDQERLPGYLDGGLTN